MRLLNRQQQSRRDRTSAVTAWTFIHRLNNFYTFNIRMLLSNVYYNFGANLIILLGDIEENETRCFLVKPCGICVVTKQTQNTVLFHWNSFVSVSFQFHFRCNHCLRDRMKITYYCSLLRELLTGECKTVFFAYLWHVVFSRNSSLIYCQDN